MKRSILFTNTEKFNFILLLKQLQKDEIELTKCGYYYNDKCTDEFTGRNWQRRTAAYVFYLVKPNGEKTQLEHKRIRGDHFDNEQKLRKKYSHWAKQHIKSPLF